MRSRRTPKLGLRVPTGGGIPRGPTYPHAIPDFSNPVKAPRLNLRLPRPILTAEPEAIPTCAVNAKEIGTVLVNVIDSLKELEARGINELEDVTCENLKPLVKTYTFSYRMGADVARPLSAVLFVKEDKTARERDGRTIYTQQLSYQK